MLKASEIIAATHAVREDFAFTGVTTDSRSVKNGELFVALQGGLCYALLASPQQFKHA